MRIMDTRRQNEHPNGQFVPDDSASAQNDQSRMENDGQWTR